MKNNYRIGATAPQGNTKVKPILLGLIATVFALTASLSTPVAASTTTVTPNDNQGWVTEEIVGGTVEFVEDDTAPLGGGSLYFTTSDSSDSIARISSQDAGGLALADVNELSYWTKQIPNVMDGGSWGDWTETWIGVPALQLQLDLDGSGEHTTTVTYNPWINNPDESNPFPGSEIENNVWQNWNAIEGTHWFSSNNVDELTSGMGGLESGIAGARRGGGPNYTIAELISKYPSAQVSAVGLSLGEWYENSISYADGVSINNNVYDFEVSPSAPATKDDCKKDGWKAFNFKNQGQCVSSLARN